MTFQMIEKDMRGTQKTSPPIDRWSEVFKEHGRIWGDGPSPAGVILIEEIKKVRDRLYNVDGVNRPRLTVLEAGYGYGRDAFPFLKVKHARIAYTGVDSSPVGHDLADETLKRTGSSAENPWFILGDFTKKNPLEKGASDFFFSHRTMHLLGGNGKIKAFLENAFDLLKPGGTAVVSARNERDFKPDQMIRNEDGTAVYKDRPTHVITFWDTPSLVNVFTKAGFVVEEVIQGSEPESTLHPDETTYFTTIKATKPLQPSP